jgi:hypothetical protein
MPTEAKTNKVTVSGPSQNKSLAAPITHANHPNVGPMIKKNVFKILSPFN